MHLVRTAQSAVCLRPLPAIDAKLPDWIELGAAPRAVLRRKVLSAVRAECDGAAFGKSSAAELAPLGDFHRAGKGKRRSRLAGCAAVAVSGESACILGWDRAA